MSVTFAPAHRDSDVAGYGFECGCGAANTGVLAPTYGEVEPLYDTPAARVTCDDQWCAADNWVRAAAIPAIEVPWVNVNNFNAAHLCEVLGLPRDPEEGLVGSIAASDFLGRVLMAMAINPSDAGVPATTGPGGASWVDCGRRAGYTDEMLPRLHALATWAVEHDRDVTWA